MLRSVGSAWGADFMSTMGSQEDKREFNPHEQREDGVLEDSDSSES